MGIVSTPVWNSPKQLGINVPEFYEITLVEKNGEDKNLVGLSNNLVSRELFLIEKSYDAKERIVLDKITDRKVSILDLI